MASQRAAEALTLLWYVESEGAVWEEAPPDGSRSRAPESYHATGNQELWLMDGGQVLARAADGMLACAMLRPGGQTAARPS